MLKKAHRKLAIILMTLVCFSFDAPSITVMASTFSSDVSVHSVADIDSNLIGLGTSVRERGSCEDLRRKGFKYNNCGTGSGGRPRGGMVHLTPSQRDCIIGTYLASYAAILKPWSIPWQLWAIYLACHNA